MEENIDFEAWAEELQGSKLDLIELLQEHIELVEENERLEKQLENAIFTDTGYVAKPSKIIEL